MSNRYIDRLNSKEEFMEEWSKRVDYTKTCILNMETTPMYITTIDRFVEDSVDIVKELKDELVDSLLYVQNVYGEQPEIIRVIKTSLKDGMNSNINVPNGIIQDKCTFTIPIQQFIEESMLKILCCLVEYSSSEECSWMIQIRDVLRYNMLQEDDCIVIQEGSIKYNYYRQIKHMFLVDDRIDDAKTIQEIIDVLSQTVIVTELIPKVYKQISNAVEMIQSITSPIKEFNKVNTFLKEISRKIVQLDYMLGMRDKMEKSVRAMKGDKATYQLMSRYVSMYDGALIYRRGAEILRLDSVVDRVVLREQGYGRLRKVEDGSKWTVVTNNDGLYVMLGHVYCLKVDINLLNDVAQDDVCRTLYKALWKVEIN